MFTRTLSLDTSKALALLSSSKICSNAYLAGGTALALLLGHRISVDLDFFSSTEFDSRAIVESLTSRGKYESLEQTEKTINGVFDNVKFSYFYYPYQLIAQTVDFEGMTLAGTEDIAAMKLVAIIGRGTKKDYIDLYFLSKLHTFEEMFSFYDKKYNLLNANLVTLIKSLSYYFDAEESEMPIMINKVDWDSVKDFFAKEVQRLSKIYL